MAYTLFDRKTAESVITRVKRLRADTPNIWGEMNATEMLMHCNSCNRQIFEEKRGNKRTTIGQFLLRLLALYIAPNFKKGLQTEPRHITKGMIDSNAFNHQQSLFIELINQFSKTTTPLTLTHPAFGNISTTQWGIAAYKHMDHHLRQFGV